MTMAHFHISWILIAEGLEAKYEINFSYVLFADVVYLGNNKRKMICHLAFLCNHDLVLRYSTQHRSYLEEDESGMKKINGYYLRVMKGC